MIRSAGANSPSRQGNEITVTLEPVKNRQHSAHPSGPAPGWQNPRRRRGARTCRECRRDAAVTTRVVVAAMTAAALVTLLSPVMRGQQGFRRAPGAVYDVDFEGRKSGPAPRRSLTGTWNSRKAAPRAFRRMA